MKHFLPGSITALVFFACYSLAQPSILKEDKKYNKALQYFEDDKIDKAIETINPLLSKYQENPEVWETAMAIYMKQYQDSKKNDELISIIQLAMDSAVKKDPSFQNISFSSPSERYLNEFQDLCYTATLKTQQQKASMYLRLLNIDPSVDKDVSKEAIELFNKAEVSFRNKDYGKALSFYDEAIKIQPLYYKANLYKGDTYFSLKDYENAILYYKNASSIQPSLFEPKKYLTDAYFRAGRLEEALESCIDGMLIYPDEGMFDKLSKIARAMGKKADIHWIARIYDVNRPHEVQESIEELPWKSYRASKEKIVSYCDSTGVIIKKNDLTNQQFMEVFGWEETLKNTTDPKFSFAQQMKEEKYLDCYAFVSEFHYGIYKQYRIFAKNNPEKIRHYIKTYLIK
jgi:tetratricopeptide (TPR) repeat protein